MPITGGVYEYVTHYITHFIIALVDHCSFRPSSVRTLDDQETHRSLPSTIKFAHSSDIPPDNLAF